MCNVFVQPLAHYGFTDEPAGIALHISLSSVEHGAVMACATLVGTWNGGKWGPDFTASTVFLFFTLSSVYHATPHHSDNVQCPPSTAGWG